MKYDVLQIVGAALMVVFVQGALRISVHHDDTGFLGWVPGGFPAQLMAHLALAATGALVGGYAHSRAKALGRRERG
ncbi:hypothetical protein DT019_03735 [Streptomyces sp. SDr-06]|uniref:hypothetical protein n=1 Tax=Streptomyces sp. SDr-06 TaxID=2267702 RepID=UPI000DEA3244|nr:hypothetical protein [Streptomyces sp. SDr-06]RCH70611.1 hypothetical protein DT019_03735 [Streptomyces sp. SDr-06]